MKHYNLCIIGGDAAGMSAASQARRIDESLSIGVFEMGKDISYAACGLPYYIADEINESDTLLAIERESFIKEKNIDISLGAEVTKINFEKKTITVNGKLDFSWDRLVIATGAGPAKPPIKGIEHDGVFFLRNLNDGIRIKNYLKEMNPRKTILIGGGFLGIELSEAFTKRGIKTTILEKMPSIAMSMAPDVRYIITETLRARGVTVHTERDIREIIKDQKDLQVITSTGSYGADCIIVSTGVRPQTSFVPEGSLRTMENGAIIVDEQSRTSRDDVFAAGDCASVKHLVTGKDVYMPLGSTANKQGRVAGIVAAGVTSEKFRGIVGTQFLKIFDVEAGKTGLNEEDAEREGIPAKTLSADWKSKAGYYPGTQKIHINITINTETGQVIGGELCGTDGAALRTDVIAAAVTAKMHIRDFAYLDLGYAPPFAPVWDPIHGAAQKFISREK